MTSENGGGSPTDGADDPPDTEGSDGTDPDGKAGGSDPDDAIAPNRNALWARALVDELAAAGVERVVFAPGSRSTPLVVAAARHPDLALLSHLDERSAGFFALGIGRRTGTPAALVCTSGTAAANFHPAVIEANQARVPLVVCTADRPPELRDSGANQTIDQEKLYGDAVRWYRDLPEPEATPRKLRRLRVDAARAVGTATGTPAGPVHLNVPFSKPLEPVPVPGDVPEDLADRDPGAVHGREGPFVERHANPPAGDAGASEVADLVETADRGLIVTGPADAPPEGFPALVDLARATGFPLLADPLSGVRFGSHVDDAPVVGGYDGFLDPALTGGWPAPEVVLRVGASPTSKPLRKYLARAADRQVVVDPAGGWREAEFAATHHVTADPDALARSVLAEADLSDDEAAAVDSDWRDRWLSAERAHWATVEEARGAGVGSADPTGPGGDFGGDPFEGAVLAAVVEAAPDPSTVFVSNSMPVRDLDRFARPRAVDLTVLGNRGASGIDGIVSTALGCGHATEDPLTLVTGDLAFYHDMNGLLALGRLDVEATVVVVDNDGGGIFHMLPIEEFDPPFTEAFRTPHGLDFEPTADLYDLSFRRTDPGDFEAAYRDAVDGKGSTVLSVEFDAAGSHRTREAIQERVVERIRDDGA
ncbi:2-succinyl-5-enolpyruvyl-6-hydroxy-3-cyclohexene-1-carboxylic-acid synthase [Halobacteriales archaeon QS_8_69_26]|nr:MAG: 2-succinyl-5-enolpyruvyl-6-hydroxy-3-cyclohexene-1-carboxylic-acid synthase [Halobacteriales archaeon QS_8_69_26]